MRKNLLSFLLLCTLTLTLSAQKIYPNPANSHLTFSVPQGNENYTVEIMNISGILLEKFNMVSGETKVISTNNLSVGLQFYRVTSSSGNISTGKIFIQK